MSELTNPLFDDEKEFLERKKLEYERALAADVEDLKDKSMAVGKVAAIGAGALGGIWLLAKLFGGKKKRKGDNGAASRAAFSKPSRKPAQRPADTGFTPDDEFYTDGMGQRRRAVAYHKSAAQSAAVFAANPAAGTDQPAHSWDRYRAANPADQGFDNYAGDDDDLTDDGGFGAGLGTADQSANVRAAASPDPDMIGAEVFANAYAAANTANASNQTKHRQAEAEAAASADYAGQRAVAPLPFAAGVPSKTSPSVKPNASAAHSDDPFAEPVAAQSEAVIPHRASNAAAFGRLAGQGIRTFLESETGRTLIAQASAVGLALVTKQLAKWRSGSQPDADVAPAAAPAVVSAPVPVADLSLSPPVAPAAPFGSKPRRPVATNKNADLAAAPAVAPSETAAPRPQNAASSDDSPAPFQSPA